MAGGAMHDGEISRSLDIDAIEAAAEEVVISRDLALAELTEGWLHVCHVSTGRGAELIRDAKRRGVTVTAEVMPHHLVMTDRWVAGQREIDVSDEREACAGPVADPDTKVNPPLRTQGDARDLVEALRSGDIDLVATDHAPHARTEKQGRPFASAAFGINGSEFALPLMLSLVRRGDLGLSDIISFMSSVPARLWCVEGGALHPGSKADIVVFDPNERWTPDPERLLTRSANSPLLNMEQTGRVKLTLVAGEERYRDW